jgi:hypothetical protein
MRDTKASFQDASARLDAFLKRAASDFGSNPTALAETERRVDEWLRRQAPQQPVRSAA